jgi:DNA polymerase III delta prime subunit
VKIKKILQRIVSKEGLRLGRAASQVLESIACASLGDLRHAITTLQAIKSSPTVHSLRDNDGSHLVESRDVNYSGFHAVGKLLHAKLSESGIYVLIRCSQIA